MEPKTEKKNAQRLDLCIFLKSPQVTYLQWELKTPKWNSMT